MKCPRCVAEGLPFPTQNNDGEGWCSQIDKQKRWHGRYGA